MTLVPPLNQGEISRVAAALVVAGSMIQDKTADDGGGWTPRLKLGRVLRYLCENPNHDAFFVSTKFLAQAARTELHTGSLTTKGMAERKAQP